MAFADSFKALSDPARRDILEMLREGRLSAGEIASKFDMTGATISYHLTQLKKAGLVMESKHKNFIFYELNLIFDIFLNFNVNSTLILHFSLFIFH